MRRSIYVASYEKVILHGMHAITPNVTGTIHSTQLYHGDMYCIEANCYVEG